MSEVPDPQDLSEPFEHESAAPPTDKKIVFGARKPTEEASPLTGIPLIIEAPFPYERTLQWLPEDLSLGTQDTANNTADNEVTVLSSRAGTDSRAESESNHKPAAEPFILEPDGNTAVVVSQEVLIKVNEHVSQSLDRELGGFLLGNRYRCPNTPRDYVIIDQFSPAKFTESTEVRLSFTHEAWAQLSDELSGKFLGKLLIGWYHSHPRMDVFLSSHDIEIQTERFPEPWMVALVLEPEKHLGGFFCSRDGRVKPNSPVDFFELLERNSRDSVIAWENYKALDPSTSSTPVLSATNTANPTNSTSQEILETRSKLNQKAPLKEKHRRRSLFVAAIIAVLLGASAVGLMYRKRLRTWLQNRSTGVSATAPPQATPSAEPPALTPEPTVSKQEVSPEPSPPASPSPSETANEQPTPKETPSPQPPSSATAQSKRQSQTATGNSKRQNTAKSRKQRR